MAPIARVVAAALVVVAALPLQAQSWRGSAGIEVRVEDARGKAVAAAEVDLSPVGASEPGGPATLATDGRGRVAIGGLAPGRWALEVRKVGFMTFRAELALAADEKPEILVASQHNVPGALSTLRVRLAKASGAAIAPARAGGQAAAPAPTAPPPPAPPAAPIARAPAVAPPQPVPPAAPAVQPPAAATPIDSAPLEPPAVPIVREPVVAPPQAAPPAAPAERAPAVAAPIEPAPLEPPAAPSAPAVAPVQPVPPAAPAARPPAAAPAAKAPPPALPASPVESAPAAAPPPAPPAPPAGRVPAPAPPSAPVPPPTAAPPAGPAAPAAAPEPARPTPAVGPSPSASERGCLECRPGESALVIAVEVESGGAACPAEVAANLGKVALSALDQLAASLPAGCALLRLELPAKSRYTGFRFAATAPLGEATDCLPGRDCPAGACRFVGQPVVRWDGERQIVLALFEGSEARRGTLTAYARAARRN